MKFRSLIRLLIPIFVLACLALPLLAQDAYQKGDNAVRIIGSYGSRWDIPGSAELESHPYNPPGFHCHCPPCTIEIMSDPEETRPGAIGVGFSHFLAEDVSLELTGTWPLGDPGMDTFSVSAGLDYFFGHAYIPLQVNYRGDLDAIGFATGGGLDYRVGKATILRGQLTGNYVGSGVDDPWGWQLGGSIGWVLGNK